MSHKFEIVLEGSDAIRRFLGQLPIKIELTFS